MLMKQFMLADSHLIGNYVGRMTSLGSNDKCTIFCIRSYKSMDILSNFTFIL